MLFFIIKVEKACFHCFFHLFTFSQIAAFTPNTPRMAVAMAAMIFRIIDAVCFPLSLIGFGF